jgi:hypothetical protein
MIQLAKHNKKAERPYGVPQGDILSPTSTFSKTDAIISSTRTPEIKKIAQKDILSNEMF